MRHDGFVTRGIHARVIGPAYDSALSAMRILWPSSTFALALGMACAHAQPATSLACEGRATGPTAGELTCPLDALPGGRQLTFVARFAGVHDDSQAAFRATVDGAPVTCAQGGTMRIEGEQGGDSLSCRFAVDTGARRLVVNLLWYHAEPVSAQVLRE